MEQLVTSFKLEEVVLCMVVPYVYCVWLVTLLVDWSCDYCGMGILGFSMKWMPCQDS